MNSRVHDTIQTGGVMDSQNTQLIQFSSLGENFSLRVPEKEVAKLKAAIDNLNEKVNARFNKNPGLTPLQCAILVALDCVEELNENNNSDSEFYKKVLQQFTKMNKIAKNIESLNALIENQSSGVTQASAAVEQMLGAVGKPL